jgi:hypothetical protein
VLDAIGSRTRYAARKRERARIVLAGDPIKGQRRLNRVVVEPGKGHELIQEYERAVSQWAECLLNGHDNLAGYWASEAERLHALIISRVESSD